MSRYDWQELYTEALACRNCGLCKGRTNVVIGKGDPYAALMIVGEGPGRDEDIQGSPFVGAAGKLLDKMLAAIDIKTEDVYICNIVKCRPPGNRAPTDDEAAACMPYLRAQFALVKPKIVLLLGATAMRYIIGPESRVTRDRGRFTDRKGTLFLGTYHPAALLRDEGKKKETWSDLKLLRAKLDELGLYKP